MMTDIMLMIDVMLWLVVWLMMITVDVDVNEWYINHIIKDVKINTHAMLWCYVMLHAMDRVFC